MHGSLTRAGKVRKQTPKVPKKEKTKKVRVGRAKKRLIYNRRFVSFSEQKKTGGKKRGLNPQKKD
jgi:small subunit ribosomal protein S30e